MMSKKLLFIAVVSVAFLSSCMNESKIIREPNTRLELEMDDFELSDQVFESASTTRVLGIDFSRLFGSNKGYIDKDETSINISAGAGFTIPVIGGFISDFTANYALHKLMEGNPGYDVVLYPQYTKRVERPIGLGIYTITRVDVTARLAKFKK